MRDKIPMRSIFLLEDKNSVKRTVAKCNASQTSKYNFLVGSRCNITSVCHHKKTGQCMNQTKKLINKPMNRLPEK